MMKTGRLMPMTVLAVLAAATAVPAAAQDASVARRLNDQGIDYDIDEDGDFKIMINYSDEGRSQLVFVSGGSQTVSGLSVREVFAPAGRVGRDGINGSAALKLLNSSAQMKIGGWEIRGDVLYFVAKVLDSASSQELVNLVSVVAETADNEEIELSGDRDDL